MFLFPLLESVPTLYYDSFTPVSFGPHGALPVSTSVPSKLNVVRIPVAVRQLYFGPFSTAFY